MAAPIEERNHGLRFSFERGKLESVVTKMSKNTQSTGGNSRGITSTSSPFPRSGHRAVATENLIYFYGGYNPEKDVFPGFREIWVYNISTRTWSLQEPKTEGPPEFASISMSLYGRCLLVYGGTSFPHGNTVSKDVWIYNIATKTWISLDCNHQIPKATYGQSILLLDNSLYVYGGTSGWNYNSDVYRLNLQTNIWKRLFTNDDNDQSDLPHGCPLPRYRQEVAYSGNQLFILGGGTSAEAYDFSKINIFNISTCHWSETITIGDNGNYPTARRCHGCVQLENDAYISGGYDGQIIFDDIWKLNLDTLAWSKLHFKLTEPVYFHATAVTCSGCMYIHGGVTRIPSDTRTSSLYRVWLKIPKLKEICWDILSKSISDIENISSDQLLQLGIPYNLVQRVHNTL